MLVKKERGIARLKRFVFNLMTKLLNKKMNTMLSLRQREREGEREEKERRRMEQNEDDDDERKRTKKSHIFISRRCLSLSSFFPSYCCLYRQSLLFIA